MKDLFEKIRVAIVERDFEKFAEHVDTEKFLSDNYAAVVSELAEHCAEYKKLYPHDLLFKFGATALKIYMNRFKSVHIGFVSRVIRAYFDKNLTAPKNFISAPIDFCAVELRKFLSALSCDIKDNSDVEIFGDNSAYGKIFGRLNFKFIVKDDKIVGVKNIPELVPPILDMAERFWPSEWDLGIKI